MDDAAVNAAFHADADADADADGAAAAAAAASINSVPAGRRARGASGAMTTAPMVDAPAAPAAPPPGGVLTGGEGALSDGGGLSEGRLLSEPTHWAIAAIAVGLLSTSAVCYVLPGKATHFE